MFLLGEVGAGLPSAGAESTSGRAVQIRLPVRRDTIVSAARGERDANLGGSQRLKTKGIVELSLFDINVERLRGALLESPVLHVRGASDDPQRRVTVSTVAAEWTEGTSTGYRAAPGSASFNWAAQGTRRWAYPGSDVTAVINGRGHTLWAFADATPRDRDGWQRIAIDPRVLAARVAGISGGFALTDDVGSEYERVAGEFRYHVFPNRFLWSREGEADSAPFLTVGIAGADREAPESVRLTPASERRRRDLRPGETAVVIRTPADRGGAGTLGFDLRFARRPPFEWQTAEEVPRYLIPIAHEDGEPVEVTLRDLDLEPGSIVEVGARAVDAAGNRGPISFTSVEVRGELASLELAAAPDGAVPRVNTLVGSGPVLAGYEVAVVDPLDKLHPVTGEMIPARDPDYRRRNHLWDATARTVRLAAARNEFTAFQVVVGEGSGRLEAEVRFDAESRACAVTAELLRYVAIPSERGALPDPLVPIESSVASNQTPEARSRSLLVDLYVPHDCPPGSYAAVLELAVGTESVELAVELEVWSFTLPDYLSFIPQMNSYGLPPPPGDLDYYRLAHRHRTCLNMVPYSWRGEVFRGYRPGTPGRDAWREWDERFGPLLDGSAFADLPRSGVPVDAFYLPLNENWPAAIEDGFGGGYWAERALSESYRERFVAGVERFAEHLFARGWDDTFFEFYLNNKLYHRREGWSRSSAYWVFDEPINTQDFWALRWYGKAFHEGVARAAAGHPAGRAKLAFRADISRPEWQRDLLDGLLDVNVVGIGFAPYLRAVMERRDEYGELVYNYGTSNRVESPNVQPAAWVLWAWSVGADGVLPWKTVGKESSWRKASPLALFYPGRERDRGPRPSIRLKAYRRGQQDVEYLTLLAAATGQPRWRVGELVRAWAGLEAVASQSGSQDAGRLDFAGADPVDLWRLRIRVGKTLDRLAPEPERRLVELRTPVRDPRALTDPPVLAPP